MGDFPPVEALHSGIHLANMWYNALNSYPGISCQYHSLPLFQWLPDSRISKGYTGHHHVGWPHLLCCYDILLCCYDILGLWWWQWSRDEITKFGGHGCWAISSDSVVFHYIPIIIYPYEKWDFEITVCGYRVQLCDSVLFKGVAMVETMRTDIGISSPGWVLKLMKATSILLLSGRLALKEKRRMSTFLHNDSRFAKSCVRKECWEPSSNRMLASALESVVVTVAVAVLNRQTWPLFEGVKVEREVVLFSVVLPWEVSLLLPESPVRLHMVFPVTFTTTIPWVTLGYLVVAQAVMAKLITFDNVQPLSVFLHCIATDRCLGSPTVYTGKSFLTFSGVSGVACWFSVWVSMKWSCWYW